jgi:hypothetical protein
MNAESVMNILAANKRRIIIGVGVLIIGILIYNIAIFRVFSLSPSPDNMPSSSRLVRIDFTQPVDSIEGVEVAGSVIDDDQIEIDGRSVRIVLRGEAFEEGKMTSVRFEKATSKWFGLTVSGYLQRFTPKYVPFNKLSDEQQKAAISSSDSAQSNDPFLNNDFPIRTDEYSIDATKDDTSSDISVVITFAKDIPDYDISPTAVGVSNQEAERLRDEALKKIRELGGKPENYSITYTNPYLSEQYTNNLD